MEVTDGMSFSELTYVALVVDRVETTKSLWLENPKTNKHKNHLRPFVLPMFINTKRIRDIKPMALLSELNL